MGNFVGIDLGTTYSAVAQVDANGRPVIVPNRDGKNVTPSVVSFVDEGNVHVGATAKRSLEVDDTTFGRFKRAMGSASKTYTAHGKEHSPTALSGLVLKKLREDAEATIGPLDGAVVTIPANFANEAREATMEAAKLAGLNIKFIVNEPTAAALYYAHRSDQELKGTYAVYDLGGGTFDVSIIRMAGQDVELLATDGVAELGGDDFDEAIRDLVATKYQQATGGKLDMGDFTKNAAEEEKLSLSSRRECKVRVVSDSGKALITITRDEFEEAISSLIEQTKMLCENALEEARVEPGDVQGVFLAGGCTRIPSVVRAVKGVFQQDPIGTANVDEVVALGASLYAAYKADHGDLNPMQQQSVNKIRIAEITSNCFGTISQSQGGTTGEVKLHNTVLIQKGVKIPHSVTENFFTVYDGQDAVDCEVTQSKAPETDPKFVKTIWKGELALPEGRPKGQKIAISFSYDENGMMHCSFLDVASGQNTEVDLHPTTASESDDLGIEAFLVE